MKNRLISIIIALTLTLSPLSAMADLKQSPSPVTHTEFTLALKLHADGFPEATSALKGWETFLNKIRLKAYIDTQDFLTNESRVYMNGALHVGERAKIPFVYDGYHSYRYFISPALNNEIFHFQMHNYFDFMMKPYFYMGLPSQYIALFTYPEAAYYLGKSYYEPLDALLCGDATRHIPYTALYELCEELDLIANEDEYYGRLYTFMRALLIECYADDITVEALGSLENWLSYLDPAEEGMTITVSGDTSEYVMGGRTLFEITKKDGRTAFALELPNEDGYMLTVSYDLTPTEGGVTLAASLGVLLEGETEFLVTITGAGLPNEGDTRGSGTFGIALSGAIVPESTQESPVNLAFTWESDSRELPRSIILDIDYLHPKTGRPALTLAFSGLLSAAEPGVLVEVDYPQYDFFSLNDQSLDEIKASVIKTLAVALLPVLLEMPASVIDSIYAFATDTGILDAIGAE